jgi:hypothetical protein
VQKEKLLFQKYSMNFEKYISWFNIKCIKYSISEYLDLQDVKAMSLANMKMHQIWQDIVFQKHTHNLYNALKYKYEKRCMVKHVIASNWWIKNQEIEMLSNIKTLVINSEFKSTEIITFPSKLIKLSLNYESGANLELPQSLQEISLGWGFNELLKPGFFPIGLKVLEMGTNFNQPITELSNLVNLTTLQLGWNFNQSIKDLPINLRHLTLLGYNQPLPKLPMYLEELFLGHAFTYSIVTGILPCNLKKLTCRQYNHFLRFGVLPHTLEYLQLIECFGFEPNSLPRKLKHLDLPCMFYPKDLPDQLEYLAIRYPSYLMNSFPSSLIELHVAKLSNWDVLYSLVHLQILYILEVSKIYLDKIPDSLVTIHLGLNVYHVVKRTFNPFSLLSKNKIIKM